MNTKKISASRRHFCLGFLGACIGTTASLLLTGNKQSCIAEEPTQLLFNALGLKFRTGSERKSDGNTDPQQQSCGLWVYELQEKREGAIPYAAPWAFYITNEFIPEIDVNGLATQSIDAVNVFEGQWVQCVDTFTNTIIFQFQVSFEC